jgi:hypothetical protein
VTKSLNSEFRIFSPKRRRSVPLSDIIEVSEETDDHNNNSSSSSSIKIINSNVWDHFFHGKVMF